MTRETTTITTPLEANKVVLKAWITGREHEFLTAPLLKSYKLDTKGTDVDASNIDVSVIKEMTHASLATWILSINDSTENVLDAVLDMRHEDYQFIIDSINEISKKK